MPYVTWLLDAAKSTGLPVIECAGWRARGHGPFPASVAAGSNPSVVVGHHTGTPDAATGDYPSLRVVRDGRSDLPGPLCNLGLGRSGTVYVVAAGVAWHAGASAFAGLTSLNDKSIGIEAESAGSGHWTPQQLDAYPRLVAACLKAMGRGADRYVSHRTCATPAGRKPDPKGIDDGWMRVQVARYLATPTGGGSVPERMEPPWAGGVTDDKDSAYDLFMFVKRNNVEIHQTLVAVQRLSVQVEKLTAAVVELTKRS